MVQCVRLVYGFSAWSEERMPVADVCCGIEEGFVRFELVASIFFDFTFSYFGGLRYCALLPLCFDDASLTNAVFVLLAH